MSASQFLAALLASGVLTALVAPFALRRLRGAQTDESKARTAKLIEEAAGDLITEQRKAVEEAIASLDASRESNERLREQLATEHAVAEHAAASEAIAKAELAALRAEKAGLEAEWRIDRHKLGNQIMAQEAHILELQAQVEDLRAELRALQARAGVIERRSPESPERRRAGR